MFTTKNFHEGQEVYVTINFPKQFYCKGRVFSCHEYATTGRVIAGPDGSFKYRVQIQFTFDLPEDEIQVQNYCSELSDQNMLQLNRPRFGSLR